MSIEVNIKQKIKKDLSFIPMIKIMSNNKNIFSEVLRMVFIIKFLHKFSDTKS